MQNKRASSLMAYTMIRTFYKRIVEFATQVFEIDTGDLPEPSNTAAGSENLVEVSSEIPKVDPAYSKHKNMVHSCRRASKSSLLVCFSAPGVEIDSWLMIFNLRASIEPSELPSATHQGIYCETLLSSLASQSHELHLANRLDRDTSGILLLTKSHKVAAKLVKAFTAHKVKKTYIALCTGPPPNWEQVTVRSGHGRSKFGAWRVYAASDVGRTLPGGSAVRSMETSFEVLSVNGNGSFREVSDSGEEGNVLVVEEKAVKEDGNASEIVVRAYPRSGRTHQIRLHCQYLGISIVGDVKYEGVYGWKGITHHAHHLHAETLSFEHPVTGLDVMLRAPLPLWATQAIQH
ncbi:RNA pseudouridine synthase [Vigna angularis]|uniref:RNA pseudouridine synthase n=1 Tax=Phaseolus angularis TaxID=3914 RepID=A0A8T0KRP7_PHAAN|nr:RNA pseudouridine synthase [Vigna angularis]